MVGLNGGAGWDGGGLSCGAVRPGSEVGRAGVGPVAGPVVVGGPGAVGVGVERLVAGESIQPLVTSSAPLNRAVAFFSNRRRV